MHYAERREQIYRPLREAGLFTWDYMYGEEYALASVITEPLTHYDELRVAAERLGLIYKRVRDVLLQAGDELLLELGVPEAALGAVRVSIQPDIPTMIGRFDFAVTPDGIRMLEFNSDTPTGIVEAFEVNDHVCQYYGLRNPNAGCKGHIREAFQQTLDAYRSTGYPVDHLVFSALDWHEEDAATTRYLHQQSGREDARFVPLSELRVFEDRLYVMDDDRPIDVLYRLHAIEKLAEDRDEDGYPTGEHVLALIANRKLAIINPPEAFLSQSKSVQALI
jgi:glutathionylspermidine synthase